MEKIIVDVASGEIKTVPLTAEEIAEIESRPPPPAPDYSALRAQAYREESDPLFFKEQRGEVPSGTWLAKVNEIKARWPE